MKWMATAALLGAVSCEIHVPSGAYSCGPDQRCPPGQHCGADLICYRAGEGPKAAPDAGSSQGDEDAGERGGSGGSSAAGSGGMGGGQAGDEAGSGGVEGGRGGATAGSGGMGAEPFHVIEVVPGDGQVLDDPTAALSIRCSAPIDADSVSSDSVTLTLEGTRVPGQITVSGSKLNLQPNARLTLSSEYTLQLTAAVKDQAGHALQAFSSKFQAREGKWQREKHADGTGAQIAVLADGQALLVWSSMGSQYSDVHASRFDGRGTWSTPLLVESNAASFDAIAANMRGRGAVSDSSISSNVAVRGYTNGPSWDSTAYLASTAYDTRLMLNEQDEVFAVLDQADTGGSGSGNLLRGYRFTLGSVSPSAIPLGNGASGNTKPSLALLNGEPRVVWEHALSSTQHEIMTGSFDPATGAPISSTGRDARTPVLVSHPAQASMIALWEQVGSVGPDIWAWRLALAGDPETPLRISDEAGNSTKPALAMDSRGRALAAWKQGGSIQAAHYTPGSGWASPETISAPEAQNPDPPAIALDDAGNGLATWTQDGATSGLNEVWAARYLRDGGWQSARRTRISDIEAATGDTLSLGVDGSGRAFVAWIEANQVWLARFE